MTLKEKNRILILDTAKKMFVEKGFKDSSMIELAQIAEVGRRTVYRHFENKDLLLIAVLTEYFDKFVSTLQDVTYKDKHNAYQRIEYLLTIYYDFFLDNIEMLHLTGMLDINIDEESRNSPIYKDFIELVGYPDTIIFDLLEIGKKDGSIKKEIESSIVSLTLNNSLLSLASRVISHKDALDSEQGIESWKMVESLSELLLLGIKND